MLDVRKNAGQEEEDVADAMVSSGLDDSYLDSGGDDDYDLFSDEEEDDEEDDEDGGGPLAGKLKFVIIGVVVLALVVVAVLVGKTFLGRSEGGEEQQQQEEQQQEQDDDGVVVTDSGLIYRNPSGEDEESEDPEEPRVNENGLTDADEQMYNEAIGIGVQNLTGNTVSQNTSPISDGDFTKDYSSTDIPMYYEIKSIRQVKDYISYTKYRTSTADGIELYWLDGEYHGKPVRLTTTLAVFKELSTSGVVPVLVEVTVTKDGNQLITGFTVDTTSQE